MIMENQTLINGTLEGCSVQYNITFIKVCNTAIIEISDIIDIIIAWYYCYGVILFSLLEIKLLGIILLCIARFLS